MNRKTLALLPCFVMIAALMLSTGCARKSKAVSPKFSETESVTVEATAEEKAPEEPRLGEGLGEGYGEGELPIPQTDKSRELAFEDASGVLNPIYFDYDKALLKPEAKAQLENIAEWLKNVPAVNCQIEGHCDERGTNEYNLALGERRALAARRYLISLGISPDRLFTISYGEERPAVDGHDESAWKYNRRDEFRISR